MRVRYTAGALDDLAGIAEYLAPRNPQSAARIRTAILATIDIIRRQPQIGRSQDIAGVRKAIVKKYSYLIFYNTDIADGAINILAVQHAAKRRLYSDI